MFFVPDCAESTIKTQPNKNDAHSRGAPSLGSTQQPNNTHELETKMDESIYGQFTSESVNACSSEREDDEFCSTVCVASTRKSLQITARDRRIHTEGSTALELDYAQIHTLTR